MFNFNQLVKKEQQTNAAFQTNKNTKHFGYKVQKINHSFTGAKLTQYAGLSIITNFLNKLGIGNQLNKLFLTIKYNTTKYSNTQVFLNILLSSFAGINRIKRISNFTNDTLVMLLLNLKKGQNKYVISSRLKSLGQKGANKLDLCAFRKNQQNKNLRILLFSRTTGILL